MGLASCALTSEKIIYDCADTKLELRPREDGADVLLKTGRNSYEFFRGLERVPSASGAKYTNDTAEFHGKGDEAIFTHDDTTMKCYLKDD